MNLLLRLITISFIVLLGVTDGEPQEKKRSYIAVTPMQFLTLPVMERLGYLKGVIDSYGINCPGRLTYEQGLILTDSMIQKFRIFATDHGKSEDDFPPAFSFVMLGLRSMKCTMPPLEAMDLNSDLDQILVDIKKGERR